MTEPMPVAKYSMSLPMNTDSLSGLLAGPAEISRRLAERAEVVLNATPQQRAAWAAENREREKAAAQRRAAVREATPRRELTLDALIDKMGWTREYAEHLVQPYCGCEDGRDGWEYCEHARDLGLAP